MTVDVQVLHGAIQYNLNSNLVRNIDIYRRTNEIVSNWNLSVRNDTGMYNGSFSAQDTVRITYNSTTLLLGYTDVCRPVSNTDYDIYTQVLELSGRDHAQDLANVKVNKGITNSNPGIKGTNSNYEVDMFPYVNKYADDIIDSVLMNAPTNIGFSPSTVYYGSTIDKITYEDNGSEYTGELLRKVLEQIDYDGNVDLNRDLVIFPIGSISSGITLTTGINILRLEQTEFDSSNLRNYVTVYGPEVNDGWSEYNASEYSGIAGNSVTADPVYAMKGGYCIKCSRGTADYIQFGITFPQFNYTYLPYDQYSNKNISFWVRGTPKSGMIGLIKVVSVRLTDTEDNVIERDMIMTSGLASADWNIWHQLEVPVGIGVPLDVTNWLGIVESNNNWTTEGETSTFSWKIKKIEFKSNLTDTLCIDGLRFEGINMVAYSEDTISQNSYGLRDMFMNAKNIYTQHALQDIADDNLAKYKDPVQHLKVTCPGSVGIINNVDKWIPGYNIVVNSPNDNINSSTFRISEVHLSMSDTPVLGHDFIAEVDLVPSTVEISSRRIGYIKNPEYTIEQQLNDAVRNLEKISEEKLDIIPVTPRLPSWNETTGEYDYYFTGTVHDVVPHNGTILFGTINAVEKINVPSASIGSLTLTYGVIGSISNIETLNVQYMSVDTISTIQEIGSCNILQAGNIGTINSIERVNVMNVGSLNNVEYLSVVGPVWMDTINNINRINNVTNFYAANASINSIGSVNTAFFLNATITTGTISTLQVYKQSVQVALFQNCTISNVDLNAGSIDGVIVANSTFNCASITFTGNLVVGQSSINTLSILSIASNNVIQNNNINTFSITYDRLVVPPIGWNLVVNGGFEYGLWSKTGDSIALSQTSPYEGNNCLRYNCRDETAGYVDSNVMNLLGVSTVVLSCYSKGTVTVGHAEAQLLKGASSSVVTTWVTNWSTIGSEASWTLHQYTYTVDQANPYLRIRVYGAAEGTANWDNLSLTKGYQYTSFVDTTTSKDRWLPDMYYSREVNEWTITGANATLVALTINTDYKAKAIIWVGSDFKIVPDHDDEMFTWQLKLDGSTIHEGVTRFATKVGDTILIYQNVWNWVDEATLTPGVHTLQLFGVDSVAGAFIVKDRYIRTMLGSYYET